MVSTLSAVSPLPELDVARVKRFVDARNERVPPEARHKIRYELDLAPGSVTIMECRPPCARGSVLSGLAFRSLGSAT